jgi:GNAT superfamily N-acetyltransferase
MFRRATLLDTTHIFDEFDCGTPSLNIYLKDRAADSQAKGYARTYVIADRDFRVVGYCSLCSGMMSRDNVPRQVAAHGAPSDIPVVLLARLAVDKNYQGLRLGADLLKHAFLMAILSARSIGVSAMLVHAKDDRAASFYSKYGFRPAKNLERAMLCSIKDMVATLAAARPDE